ncbi:MAG: hypothetical protein QOI83_446 [Streptomycetaceae bacterium]|nr:hypothetical protein [Streptomycetaceae bacterium]
MRDMDGETLFSIGDLARRTGLPVKTIRFYSDLGVVPPTDRTPAGYRLYDLDALARLELVRTLRDLGIDLATIQRVLEREITSPRHGANGAAAGGRAAPGGPSPGPGCTDAAERAAPAGRDPSRRLCRGR